MKNSRMKIGALLVAATLLNAAPNSFAAENLVKNGEFAEKGDADRKAKDWTSSSWWQWQWKESVGIDGTPGMHLTATSVGYQNLKQEIAVEKNTDYTISYYYKQPDPGHTFQVLGLTQNDKIISEQWMKSVVNEWTRVEYTFNSGENEKIQILLKQMCDVGGDKVKADVYVDDVTLYARRPEITDISVSGYASVSESLTVHAKSLDSFGDSLKEPEYQWQMSENGKDWTDIDGETRESYEIAEEDSGLYLRVKVTPVSEGKDGTERRGKAAFSKVLKVREMTAHFPVDISEFFNEKLIAKESELKGTVVLDEEGVLSVIGENNVILHNEIPYVIEFNGENSGIITKADEDLVIGLGNEYLSSVNFVFSYSEMPEGEQKAIIDFSDGTNQEISYTPGSLYEKSEGAINSKGFGMYMEDGTKEADKGFIYPAELKIEKVSAIKSVTFPGAKTEGKLVIYAVSGTRVDKNIIKEKIEAEILAIPENLKPADFSLLDNIEESAKTYELLGGNISDISGFDTEKFKSLRVKGVLNAYNDGDTEQIFDDENGFLYEEALGFDALDSDGVTIYSLYEDLLSDDGKKAVQDELLKKDFETVSDLQEKLLKEIVLKAIAYPNVGGVEYIADILTEENIEKIGLDAEKYLASSDKAAIHKAVAKKIYSDFEELEKALVPGTKKSPQKGSGGGGGGGIGMIPAVTQKPVEEDKKEEEPQNQDNPTELVMFKDVTDKHWAYKPIYRLKDLGIVSGKSEKIFDPDGFVTREEFIKMICIAFEIKNDNSKEMKFSDVVKDSWYEGYVKTAFSKGIVNGTDENRFGIGVFITRQDLCVMAARVKGMEKQAEPDFVDADEISEYAKGAVSYLSENGVVNGFENGSFKPQEKCTRAQAAKIIYELMELWREE